ncbi:MAG: GNAT family N-acetyltransferase [Patescibacteria group bacterium]
MKVIKADKSHKNHVLRLLDDFRTACMAIINPAKNSVSTTAKETGGDLFDQVIVSSNSVIFLAVEKHKYAGIATIHKIPQIRKGGYCAEIEEMFVEPEFQGKGVAQLLIDAIVKWAKKENINTVRLESSNELKRAHGFYEKAGFRFYGRAYEKRL